MAWGKNIRTSLYGDPLATAREAGSSIFAKPSSPQTDWMKQVLAAAEEEGRRRKEEEARKQAEAMRAESEARRQHQIAEEEHAQFVSQNKDRFGANTDNVYGLLSQGKQAALAWGSTPEGQSFLGKTKPDEFAKDPFTALANHPVLQNTNYGLNSPDDLAGQVPDDVQEALNFWFQTKQGEGKKKSPDEGEPRLAGSIQTRDGAEFGSDINPDASAGDVLRQISRVSAQAAPSQFASAGLKPLTDEMPGGDTVNSIASGIAPWLVGLGPLDVAMTSGQAAEEGGPIGLGAHVASGAVNAFGVPGEGAASKAIGNVVGKTAGKVLAKAGMNAAANAGLTAAADYANTGSVDLGNVGVQAAIGGGIPLAAEVLGHPARSAKAFNETLAKAQGRAGKEPAFGMGLEDVSGAQPFTEETPSSNLSEASQPSLRGKVADAVATVFGGKFTKPDDIPPSGPLNPLKRGLNELADRQGRSLPYNEVVENAHAKATAFKDAAKHQGEYARQIAQYAQSLFKPVKGSEWLVHLPGETTGHSIGHIAESIADARKLGSESVYESLLTPEQLKAVDTLVDAFEPFRQRADELNIDLGDLIDGYIPRGNAIPPGDTGVPLKRTRDRLSGAKASSEKARKFENEADAIAAGVSYPNVSQAIKDFTNDWTARTYTASIAKDVLEAADENGQPIVREVPKPDERTFPRDRVETEPRTIKTEGGVPAGWSRFTGIDALEGKMAPTEFVNFVNAKLRTEQKAPLHTITGVANLVNEKTTALNTVGDLFTTAGRLRAAATAHPFDALKSNLVGVKSLKDAHASTKLLIRLSEEAKADDLPTYAEFLGSGGAHGHIGREGILGKVPIIKQDSRFIGSTMNAYRYMAYLSELRFKRRAGVPLDANLKAAAARGINLISGEPNQFRGARLTKGALQFPNWFNSLAETAYKAVSDGSIEGEMARKSLAGLMATGVIAAYAINEAGGNDTDWKNGFPVIHVGKIELNTGGAFATLAKTIGLLSPVSPDRDMALQNPLEAPKYLIRSRGNPIARTAFDFLPKPVGGGGKTFIGDDATFKDPRYLASQFAPFGSADIDKKSFTDPTQAASEVLNQTGFSNFVDEPTKFEQAADIIDTAIRKQFPDIHPPTYGDKYKLSDLNDSQKDALKLTPEYAQYKATVGEAAAALDEKGPDAVEFIKTAYATEKDRHAAAMAGAEEQYAQDHNGNRYRKNVADEQSKHIAAEKDIEEQSKQTKLGRSARDYKTGDMRDDLTVGDVFSDTQPEDQAVSAYYSIYDQPGSKSPDGTPNWDVVDERQQQYLDSLDPKTRSYVENRLAELDKKGVTDSKGNAVALPTLAKLDQVKAAAKDYYAVRDTEFAKLQSRDKYFQQFDSYSDFLDQVQQAADAQGVQYQDVLDYIQKRHYGYKMFSKNVDRAQRKLRGSNSVLDYGLQTFYNKPAVNWKGYIANQYGDTQYDALGPSYANRSGPTALQQGAFAKRYGGTLDLTQ